MSGVRYSVYAVEKGGKFLKSSAPPGRVATWSRSPSSILVSGVTSAT
jgi:hypothetical protein